MKLLYKVPISKLRPISTQPTAFELKNKGRIDRLIKAAKELLQIDGERPLTESEAQALMEIVNS